MATVFTLVDNPGGKFAIQGNNVVLVAPLDYETAPSHTLTVNAQGITPSTIPLTFIVPVTDVVEPTINLSNNSVLESAPSGTTIGLLSVANTTGTPSFSLVDSAGGKFAISGDSLLSVSALGPIDFETSSAYTITVAVAGTMPVPVNRTFTINIIDVPKSILLSSNTIMENVTNGTVIGSLSVWEGTGTYIYTVVADPDGLFTIDSQNLDKAGVVDYENKTSHQVTVRADNGAGDIINQVFTINVINVDDAPAPVVVSFSPEDNAEFVDPNVDLIVTLSTTVVLGTGNIHLKKVSDNTIVETWNVATEAGSTAGKVEVVGGNKLTMHRTTSMPEVELYVIWDAGVVKNLENEGLAAQVDIAAWSFKVQVFSLSALTPGMVFAFRKLVTAYAGSCVRIRASGDNTQADFGFVADEVDTAGIAAFVTTHGGSPFIVTWYDQSGIGTNVTQATPANQPLFVASGINGKPVARFDGVNDTLNKVSVLFSTFTNADEITVMTAVKQNGAIAQNSVFGWTTAVGNSIGLQCTYDNTIYFDFGPDRVAVAQPTGWDDTPHIVEAYRTIADSQAVLVDGVSLISETKAGSPTGTNTFGLGSIAGVTTFFGGDMAEFVIFKITVGPSARSILRGNMSVRYDIDV